MSYRAGVGVELARMLRWEAGDPRIICDGCGLIHGVTARSGMPYRWFLNRKGPPGWKSTRGATTRSGSYDLCPRCKKAELVGKAKSE